jgi:(4S)-4-hydroxy-5-phosphonooxypentane-2,3-dione isomerase
MKGYVIAVEFDIAAGHFAAFMPLMTANAEASRRNEKGCRRFDVCVPRERKDCVFLYEIYDDEAAFQAHLQSSHFKEFAEAAKDMITGRRIIACDWVA